MTQTAWVIPCNLDDVVEMQTPEYRKLDTDGWDGGETEVLGGDRRI